MRQKVEFSKCQSPSLPSAQSLVSSPVSLWWSWFFSHKNTYFPLLTDDIALLNVFPTAIYPRWTSSKSDDKFKPVGPQRGLWSTTVGGEFPHCFWEEWKRLIYSKQWFPKPLTELHAKFGWKSVTASSSALPHRCWLAWLSLLPEQSHNVPCPPVGNHKFLLGLCQNPNCHRVWKPDVRRAMWQGVWETHKPQTKLASPPIWRKH